MLAARPPGTVEALAGDNGPRLLASIDEAVLRAISTSPEDLERLRRLRPQSAVIVPLRARGRQLGSLTLIATADSGRRYGPDDLEFTRVLSGRAALALDNAGLFSELETIEAQLTAALSTLAEAVTVQHTEGALIYANEAAARMLGYDSPAGAAGDPRARRSSSASRRRWRTARRCAWRRFPAACVLAGEEPEPMVTRAINKATGEERWRVTKASGVYDRDGNVKLVVNVIEDITEVKRAELTQRLLARAGELLASSLDYERTLQQVAELAVPQLADWCAVSMPDGHGFIRQVAVAHADPDKVAFARRIGERYPTRADAPGGSAQIMRDGVSQVVNEISDEMLAAVAQDDEHRELLASVGMRAGLAVPMSAAGKTVGVLTLISAESARSFSDADVKLAEELARRAGTAVENARLYTERSHIAHTLQTELLPGRLPQMPGWEVATLYRPAGDENWVGGDFYDAIEVDGGWLAIVGDVAGRGAEAAALTGLARHTLRTAARLLDDPLDAIGTLNAELRQREQMALCSVAAVLLREHDGAATAQIVCAGHPLPLLVRDGQARTVGDFSPMLGAYPVERWSRTTIELDPGDVLVLYTDGVFDAVGEHGRFGEERLQRTVAAAGDAIDAVARIDAALSDFEVGEQADDTAVLAVERVAVTAASGAARRRAATERAGDDERATRAERLSHARLVAHRRRARGASSSWAAARFAPAKARAWVAELLARARLRRRSARHARARLRARDQRGTPRRRRRAGDGHRARRARPGRAARGGLRPGPGLHAAGRSQGSQAGRRQRPRDAGDDELELGRRRRRRHLRVVRARARPGRWRLTRCASLRRAAPAPGPLRRRGSRTAACRRS